MRSLAVPALALALAGCVDTTPAEDRPGFAARDSVLQLREGDVRIVSTDGQLELAVLGDRVLMRMSDAAVAKLRRDLDTTAVASAEGVGSWVEKKVKGTVASVLDKQMVMPAALISEASYVDGEIRIRMRGSEEPMLFPGSGGQASTTARFAPGEAERFVAAVQAARSRRS